VYLLTVNIGMILVIGCIQSTHAWFWHPRWMLDGYAYNKSGSCTMLWSCCCCYWCCG